MRADRQEMKDRYYRDASTISELGDRAGHQAWRAHCLLIEFCDPLPAIVAAQSTLQDALAVATALRETVEREQRLPART